MPTPSFAYVQSTTYRFTPFAILFVQYTLRAVKLQHFLTRQQLQMSSVIITYDFGLLAHNAVYPRAAIVRSTLTINLKRSSEMLVTTVKSTHVRTQAHLIEVVVLNVENRVPSQASPKGICGGLSGINTGFSPSTTVPTPSHLRPFGSIPPMIDTDSFITDAI